MAEPTTTTCVFPTPGALSRSSFSVFHRLARACGLLYVYLRVLRVCVALQLHGQQGLRYALDGFGASFLAFRETASFRVLLHVVFHTIREKASMLCVRLMTSFYGSLHKAIADYLWYVAHRDNGGCDGRVRAIPTIVRIHHTHQTDMLRRSFLPFCCAPLSL